MKRSNNTYGYCLAPTPILLSLADNIRGFYQILIAIVALVMLFCFIKMAIPKSQTQSYMRWIMSGSLLFAFSPFMFVVLFLMDDTDNYYWAYIVYGILVLFYLILANRLGTIKSKMSNNIIKAVVVIFLAIGVVAKFGISYRIESEKNKPQNSEKYLLLDSCGGQSWF